MSKLKDSILNIKTAILQKNMWLLEWRRNRDKRNEWKADWEISEDRGLKPSVCFLGMTRHWNETWTLHLCVCVCVCVCVCAQPPVEVVYSYCCPQGLDGERNRLWIFCILFHFLFSRSDSTGDLSSEQKQDQGSFFQTLELYMFTLYMLTSSIQTSLKFWRLLTIFLQHF